MNLKRFSGGTLGLLALSALACACSSKADDCNANKNCAPYDSGGAGSTGTSGSAGTSGSPSHSGSGGVSGTSGRAGAGAGSAGTSTDAGAAGAPSTCDGTLSPDADNCVISDDYGVFVAPTGDDTTGDGTEAAPFATLTTALTKLDQIKRIYVCAAEYTEVGTLQIPSGVAIYGGFGCDGGVWSYDSKNNKASFKPQSPIGAEIKNASGVTLEDLSITATDATGPGASSFGLMVVGSDDVALTRVVIKAGKGGAGTSGSKGDDGLPGAASEAAQNGNPGTCMTPTATVSGGVAVPAKCLSQGGNGGVGYITGTALAEQNGGVGSPVLSANGGPSGMMAGEAGTEGKGGKGGDDGALGASAPEIGIFSATGYSIASGPSGTGGKPGQGGGGGGASFVSATCVGSGGGAGGMGGCGGLPGMGGTGGGASIAVMSWRNKVTLESCVLTAAVGGGGGDGGIGGIGGAGQTGGSGGSASAGVKSGGAGGKGGDGGDGGSGAGGTGGPSIALVFDGTEPVRKNTKLEFPTKGGAAGQGGHFGADSMRWGPDGSVGVAQDIYPKAQ